MRFAHYLSLTLNQTTDWLSFAVADVFFEFGRRRDLRKKAPFELIERGKLKISREAAAP
jgi:hypothetical protein